MPSPQSSLAPFASSPQRSCRTGLPHAVDLLLVEKPSFPARLLSLSVHSGLILAIASTIRLHLRCRVVFLYLDSTVSPIHSFIHLLTHSSFFFECVRESACSWMLQVHTCAWVCGWRPASQVLSSVNLSTSFERRYCPPIKDCAPRPTTAIFKVQLSLLTKDCFSWAC